MPKRIPLGAIGVTRDGKTVYPTVGEVFDFTAEELADIRALEKASKSNLVRNPIVESSDADQGGAAVTKELGQMNLAELKAEAADRGVELGEATTKAQIVAVLEAAAEDL